MPKGDIASLNTPGVKPKKAGNLAIRIREGECGDGCGGKPVGKKRTFRQGHDASLRHKLIAAHLAGVGVEINGTAKTAASLLQSHGWDVPDPSAKRKSRAKASSAKSSKKATARKKLQTAKRPSAKRKLRPVPDVESDAAEA